MNILDLKTRIFNDLSQPVGFLSNKGFFVDGPITSASVHGGCVYFRSDGADWVTTTGQCRVVRSTVNTFESDEQFLSLKVSPDWVRTTVEKLKLAAKMAFDQQLLAIPETEFEMFWQQCRKPSETINIVDYAYTRRGHHRQFINMFNGESEITGTVGLPRDSTVNLPIRWSLWKSDEGGHVEFGFRPQLTAGIQVVRMGGPPPQIKKPWDWSTVNFNTLSVPMYDSFIVKTPALQITEVFHDSCRFDLTKKPEFAQTMALFHNNANADAWDGIIYLKMSKRVCVGAFVIASVFAHRNNTNIQWHCPKFLLVHPNRRKSEKVVKTVGKRKDADNMDNFPVSKTKRLCISDGTDDHMIA